jgi:Rod binding domain-containing protein
MQPISTSSSSASTVATLSPPLATPAVALKSAKAAREFEANLIASLLQSFEKTFAQLPGEDAVPGADDYNYLGTQAMASAIAARGGFGIAAMISRYLSSHESVQEAMHESKG